MTFSLLRHFITYCVVLLSIASLFFPSFSNSIYKRVFLSLVHIKNKVKVEERRKQGISIDLVIAINITDIVVNVIIVIIILIYSTRSAVGVFYVRFLVIRKSRRAQELHLAYDSF